MALEKNINKVYWSDNSTSVLGLVFLCMLVGFTYKLFIAASVFHYMIVWYLGLQSS